MAKLDICANMQTVAIMRTFNGWTEPKSAAVSTKTSGCTSA
jgi:hypothetical protein